MHFNNKTHNTFFLCCFMNNQYESWWNNYFQKKNEKGKCFMKNWSDKSLIKDRSTFLWHIMQTQTLRHDWIFFLCELQDQSMYSTHNFTHFVTNIHVLQFDINKVRTCTFEKVFHVEFTKLDMGSSKYFPKQRKPRRQMLR